MIYTLDAIHNEAWFARTLWFRVTLDVHNYYDAQTGRW